MVITNKLPNAVSKLMQTTTPCAPSKRHTTSKEKASGGKYNKNSEWVCLHPDEALEVDRLINQLSQYVNHCKRRDDGCRFKALKNRGLGLGALEARRLRPRAPNAWSKKPTTWLMTDDFERVLRQYEEAYPSFAFLGASPIDFEKPFGNSCVWPEMCNFNLRKAAEQGKTKIGLVFNEDYHYQKGSHWICAFLDIPKKVFYFIDSVGNPIPKEVKDFAERLSVESEELYGEKIKLVVSTMPHQRGNNQCGMYCLFFIISLLTETATYEELMSERIPDGAMHELRRFLFRHTPNIQPQMRNTPQKVKKTQKGKQGKSKRGKTQRRAKSKSSRRQRTSSKRK